MENSCACSLNRDPACNPVKAADQGRVLLVDNDDHFRSTLKGLFQFDGYEVIETDSVRNLCRQFKNSAPDLIILEAVLPGVDGFAACDSWSQNTSTRRIPVIMVSAVEDCDLIDWAFDIGVSDFMTKPIHETILRNRAKVLIAQSRENMALQQDHRQLMDQFERHELEIKKVKGLFRDELLEHKRTRRLFNHFKQKIEGFTPHQALWMESEVRA